MNLDENSLSYIALLISGASLFISFITMYKTAKWQREDLNIRLRENFHKEKDRIENKLVYKLFQEELV